MSAYGQFVRELEKVPWFSRLGEAIDDASIARILSFDDWPGPQEPLVERMHLEQQQLFDDLRATEPAASADFDALVSRVLRDISERVDFDTSSDAWDGPSSAAWHAAWTAALFATCLRLDRDVPIWLRDQWLWFQRGHWPTGYRSLGSDGKPTGLVIL